MGETSSTPVPGAPHLDALFGYARYYAAEVVVETPGMFVVGPPIVVLTVALWAAKRQSRAQTQARAASAPQWRDHVAARTVVTANATWCRLDNGWFAFPHDAVVDYALNGMTIVMTFRDCAPLALTGPAARTHALMFAQARYGA